MDLTFWLARGFDFVLSLGVTTPLIAPVMRALIKFLVFWELILVCWKARSLGIRFVSLQVWDNLIGSTKLDLFEILLKDCFRGNLWDHQYRLTRASVLSVPLLTLGSKSTSLSAWFSFVSSGCMIGLVFCCVPAFWSYPVNLVSTYLGLGSKSTSLSPWFFLCRPK